MSVIMKDFAEGCSCFLCGSYFENPENPGEKFRHEERVVCIECWNALTKEGQSMVKKARVKTKVEDINP